MNTESAMSKSASRDVQKSTPENIAWVSPRVDIYENTEEFLLLFDVPGATLESVQVELHRNELTLEAKADIGRNSRGYRRAFQVPDGIRADAVAAELRNGILQVHLPKSAEEKPRKIRIEAPN